MARRGPHYKAHKGHHTTHAYPEPRQRRSSLTWSQNSSEYARTRHEDAERNARQPRSDPVVDGLREQIRQDRLAEEQLIRQQLAEEQILRRQRDQEASERLAYQAAVSAFFNVALRISFSLGSQNRERPLGLLDLLEHHYSALRTILARRGLENSLVADRARAEYEALRSALPNQS
jgi:hypothetical protein